jgi:hypothetical protein
VHKLHPSLKYWSESQAYQPEYKDSPAGLVFTTGGDVQPNCYGIDELINDILPIVRLIHLS